MEQRERRQLTTAGPYRRKDDMIEAVAKLKSFSKEEQALIVKKAGDLMEENPKMEASAAIFKAIESRTDRRQDKGELFRVQWTEGIVTLSKAGGSRG